MRVLRNSIEVRGAKTEARGENYGRQITVLDLCALVNMLCFPDTLWKILRLLGGDQSGELRIIWDAECWTGW